MRRLLYVWKLRFFFISKKEFEAHLNREGAKACSSTRSSLFYCGQSFLHCPLTRILVWEHVKTEGKIIELDCAPFSHYDNTLNLRLAPTDEPIADITILKRFMGMVWPVPCLAYNTVNGIDSDSGYFIYFYITQSRWRTIASIFDLFYDLIYFIVERSIVLAGSRKSRPLTTSG